MKPRLECPRCGQQALSIFQKGLVLDWLPRSCGACGARIILQGNTGSFLLSMFVFTPVVLLPVGWMRLIALVLLALMLAAARIYLLGFTLHRDEINFGP